MAHASIDGKLEEVERLLAGATKLDGEALTALTALCKFALEDGEYDALGRCLRFLAKKVVDVEDAMGSGLGRLIGRITKLKGDERAERCASRAKAIKQAWTKSFDLDDGQRERKRATPGTPDGEASTETRQEKRSKVEKPPLAPLPSVKTETQGKQQKRQRKSASNSEEKEDQVSPLKSFTSPAKKKKKESRATGSSEGQGVRRMVQHHLPSPKAASVAITGVNKGEILRGRTDSESDGIVILMEGSIPPAGKVVEECGRETSIQATMLTLGISLVEAEHRHSGEGLGDVPDLDEKRSHHASIGKLCLHKEALKCPSCPVVTFRLLSPGALWKYAADIGPEMIKKLEGLVDKPGCRWSDVLSCVGTKILCLSAFRFVVGGGPQMVKEEDIAGTDHVIDATSDTRSVPVLYRIDKQVVVKVNVGNSFHPRQLMELAREVSPESIEVVKVLDRLTPGQLRSLLQKTIRRGGKQVAIPLQSGSRGTEFDSKCFPSGAVAVACIALFGAHPGEYYPELHKFLRGVTTCLKRFAVVLVEDGWVPDTDVITLLAMSLLTKLDPSFFPPRRIWEKAMRTALQAPTDRWVVRYEGGNVLTGAGNAVSIPGVTTMGARLLNAVGTFPSDVKMYQTAKVLVHAEKAENVEVMDLSWAFDQHPCRGISSLIPGDMSVKEKHAIVWKQSGSNPRRGRLPPCDEVVAAAQRRLCYSALGLWSVEEPPVVRSDFADLSNVELDPGVLSSAVGPVQIRVAKTSVHGAMNVLAVLGTSDPSDVTVMLPPSRSSADLTPDKLTQEIRDDAVQQMQQIQHPLNSPFSLPGNTAVFHEGRWCVVRKGSSTPPVPWDEARRNIKLEVCRLEGSPPPVPSFLVKRGKHAAPAVHEGAEAWITCRARSLVFPDGKDAPIDSRGRAILQRSVNMLHQKTTSVALPVPRLDGGLAPGEMKAAPLDAAVFSLLDEISSWFPGALLPRTCPVFHVTNTLLLRVIESKLVSVLSEAQQAETSENEQKKQGKWKLNDARPLMLNQKEVAQELIDRWEAGHRQNILVMDTGFGKTQSAAEVIRRLIVLKQIPGPVLWVSPPEAQDSSLSELTTNCGLEATIIKKNSHPVFVASSQKPSIYIVKHDHVRQMEFPDPWNVFTVVDEVHTCYNATQRTSVVKDLCQNSLGFLAMTATPVKAAANHEEHAQWLRMCSQFPVSAKKFNWLVAASRIVSRRIELGIAQVSEVRRVKIPIDTLRAKYIPSLRDSQWLAAAAEVYRLLQADTVVRVVEEELDKTGGVLVEVRTKEEAAEFAHRFGQERACTLPEAMTSQKPVAVVTSDQCLGYNWASRLGSLVRCELPSNAAQRRQMRGRILRMGQKRKEVRFVTVVMAGGIDEVLNHHHSNADNANKSLESMAKLFDIEQLIEAVHEAGDT